MAKTNIEIAQHTQEKFHFYMTALVFTLLGLSIQTASFGNSITANFFELSGWMSFFLSGLAALYRLELVPNVYESAYSLNKLKNQKNEVLYSKNKGNQEVFIVEENKSENIDKYLKELNEKIDILETHVKKSKDRLDRRYMFHRWSFIVGFIFIIFARGYSPVANILETYK